MANTHRLLSLMVLTVLAACDAELRIESANGNAAQQEAEIERLELAWSDMYGAGDIDGMMELMAEDTVLLLPGTEPIEGIDAVRADTIAGIGDGSSRTSWRPEFIRVSRDGTMAYDYGTSTTVMPDGSTVTGRYLVVWVNEGDGWKVAAEMIQ